jgi:hypothetical protein
VALVLGLLCAHTLPAGAAGDDAHTLRGFLSLQSTGRAFAKECRGSGGYVDLGPGTPVVVRNGDGQVLAKGEFGSGKGSGAKKAIGYGAHAACVFTFVVKNVPEADTYSLQVSHRGALDYTYEELEATHWRIGSVLGG